MTHAADMSPVNAISSTTPAQPPQDGHEPSRFAELQQRSDEIGDIARQVERIEARFETITKRIQAFLNR